jgi:VanZ family protein
VILLRYWAPAVVWAAAIFSFSTDSFSSAHTQGIIFTILQWLLPEASATTLDLLHELIRKCGHFAEYFVLGLLLLRAIRGPSRGWTLRWATLAFVIAAAYAGLDEFHQLFVPSREATPWDSVLDATGAAAAQFAIWVTIGRRRRQGADGEPREAAGPDASLERPHK